MWTWTGSASAWAVIGIVWLGLSVLVGAFLGAFIRAGGGEEKE